MSQTQRQQYNFPKLPITDIHRIFGELGFDVKKEDISIPTREFTTPLFECLAELCLGVNHEEFSQPAFAGLQAINFPELHDESIPHMNSLRAISKMMEICQIPDFSLRDIINPDKNRFLRQLSGVLNFVRFREERLILFNELNLTRQEIVDSLQHAKEKHDASANRLSLLKEQSVEDIQMMETLQRDCSAFDDTIKDYASKLEFVENRIHQSKEEISKVKEQLDSNTLSYQDMLSAQSHYVTQIVSSPKKFRNQILVIGQLLQHEQKDGKIANKKIREISAWMQNVEESHNVVKSAYDHLQDIRVEVEKQKSMIVELDTEKQGITTVRNELSLQQQNTQQMTRQITRQEEKLTGLRKQATIRGDERTRMMEELHQQLMEVESFRVQIKGKAERVESEVYRMEKDVEAEHLVHTQELGDIKSTYARLEAKVMQHLQSLQRALVDAPAVPFTNIMPPHFTHNNTINCV